VSQYQKGKTNLDLLEQDILNGSGISWAICKSAPCPRQLTMPAPHHSVLTDRMPFLPPNQEHQNAEGIKTERFGLIYKRFVVHMVMKSGNCCEDGSKMVVFMVTLV